MRAIMIPLALAASLSLPLAAQSARFIKVDIVSKSFNHHHRQKGEAKSEEGPTEVHVRMPISLAKGVLDMAGEGEIKVNGETKKGMKPEQLIKLLTDAKAGDLLLEITTDKGDHVRVTIE
ncbi:hypothetical protein [Geothrix sp. PMB-07]|uniref:hypothetical protein n=1 Tax=Geothrix sp. PMB-07 TaxID=3068640 RepID=UPI002740E827|nr:hypothetical protein [Geothrix sp. PMB-07]WLT32870.1 hypothetical protein Q9293_05935 [Geothrix sp. PMB-07]